MAEGTCAVEGCGRVGRLKRGWCTMHYGRWRVHGSLEDPRPPERLCTVEGCGRKHYALGFCTPHRARLRMHGDVQPDVIISRSKPDDDLAYAGAHGRVFRTKGKAAQYACLHCGGPAKQWAYDHTDPNERIGDDGHGWVMVFSTDPLHYIPLCALCHKRLDLAHPTNKAAISK